MVESINVFFFPFDLVFTLCDDIVITFCSFPKNISFVSGSLLFKFLNNLEYLFPFVCNVLIIVVLFAYSHSAKGIDVINRATSSPPSTDHQLQPSPSTPPPHPQKRKNPSSNRLGRGVEKPEGPSALQSTTES